MADIPAAAWAEAADGERGLVASSAAAHADLTPSKTTATRQMPMAFLFLDERIGLSSESFGGYVTADGARAVIAVLSRWLVELDGAPMSPDVAETMGAACSPYRAGHCCGGSAICGRHDT